MTETASQPVNHSVQSAPTDLQQGASSATPNELPPAVRVALVGEHLIEASAGTGKTWTLTGILLRLLIEAKRAPEQIIATTFTRAAAAEMRQRVHERLLDFFQVLQWLNNLQDNADYELYLYPAALQILPEPNEDSKQNKSANQSAEPRPRVNKKLPKISRSERAALIKAREDWLKEQAQLTGMSDRVDDPINLHLVGFLLDNVTTYPLSDAIRRTALVLTTLDKLFVGTLDSLAQKWLSEYSAETGYRKGMGITEDIEAVTDGIIHDEVRRFQSKLYYEQPKIYQLLQEKGKITTIDNHRKAVSKALTFISAPIDEVFLGEFSLESYETLISNVIKNSYELHAYFDPSGEYYGDVKGQLSNNRHSWADLIKDLEKYGIAAYSHINKDKYKNKLIEAFGKTDTLYSQFYKNAQGEIANNAFNELDSVEQFKRYIEQSEKLNLYLANIVTNLNRNIALKVRDKLASILEERNETTFTLQMVRLNQALSGRQGHKLARYIRHHYPVALIDESQDINGEQAQMIERIYLPSETNTNPTHEELVKGANTTKSEGNDKEKKISTFLLLVGDPKQAIYGFRGGDVANYNYMKAKFTNSIMTLNLNRRSNAYLIDALNHWFGCPTPLATASEDSSDFELTPSNENSLSISNPNANSLSELGENIHYQYIEAHNQSTKLSWQLLGDSIAATNSPEAENNKQTLDTSLAPTMQDLLPTQPVTVIHLPKDDNDYDESEATAFHIAALLESQQTIEGRPIRPNDIGVLGRRKKELKQIEDHLTKLKVATLSTSEVSIFETTMAADLVALMEAMLRSYRRDTINRALTSQFFGLSLRQVKAMMLSHDQSGAADNDLTVAAKSSDAANRDKNSQRYQDFITHIKEAAERWQKRGILPALHHLLGNSPIHPKGAWQSLAALPDGERHIMDLRHLLDILAQYSMNMGEHELLSWYKQNMETAPTGDWAIQQPLPTESGVQLMTIHKSKGLEFPIVYVLGMDADSPEAGFREDYGLYLYNAQELQTSANTPTSTAEETIGWQRQLSPVKGKPNDEKFFTDIETLENYSERKRLGYVAFTRASEQLYIVLKDLSSRTKLTSRPAFFWLGCEDKELVLPERLKPQVGWLDGSKVFTYNKAQKTSGDKSAPVENTPSSEGKRVTPIQYPDLDQLMPDKFFYGWAKTSFTALARQLSEQSQDLAIMDERVDDDLYIATTPSWSNTANSPDTAQFAGLKPVDDIRFSFVKGANAGTFLHEIFEKIDFTEKTLWSAVIDKAIRDYQLPISYASSAQQQRQLANKNKGVENKIAPGSNEQNQPDDSTHQDLLGWIEEVLATPLLASNQPLSAIPTTHRFAELGFNMGLSETFRAEKLNDIFQQYLPDEPDKHVVLTKHNIPHLYRYLRGEIDLVYEHAGKYYVVDYKSNYLGNSLSEYNEHTLTEAMNKAGYWLQAAIYQVALHRFLAIRISDYIGNEEKYLGAVEYVFLRGTLAVSNDDGVEEGSTMATQQRFGLVKWDIPIDFIKALDAAFGKPSR
ncbi:UvrD-helicase domain-containing protein [Psychrobacter arenosus]|uniref:UvrD-helicase domain-containing protein n=1 Tax=Psychrobacter arenosus TaxID=256326 RepID=UPI001919E0D7|nr:UvrD-helicase domain-containing protein [Psychrobacter arenosus]